MLPGWPSSFIQHFIPFCGIVWKKIMDSLNIILVTSKTSWFICAWSCFLVTLVDAVCMCVCVCVTPPFVCADGHCQSVNCAWPGFSVLRTHHPRWGAFWLHWVPACRRASGPLGWAWDSHDLSLQWRQVTTQAYFHLPEARPYSLEGTSEWMHTHTRQHSRLPRMHTLTFAWLVVHRV